MSALLWALVGLPLGVGALLAAAAGRANRVAAPVAVGTGAATLALAVAATLTGPAARAPFVAGMPLTLRVDGLSLLLVPTVAAVTLLVLVFSAGELRDERGRARFFGLLLAFAGAMLVTVTAADLLSLLLAWEVMGATSWALIAHWWQEERRVRAAHTAFWTTRLADVGLYLAVGAAMAGAGTVALDALPGLEGGWATLATAGIVVAALGKSAQLPFSFWLARAMEGPSPVSALLHSATMVAAGGYLLLRVEPLLATSGWAADAVAWTGVTTAVALGAVALAQTDLKQLLAASTCSQLGFVVLAAGAGGVAGGAMHVVAHAATKSLLFLAAGAWLTALGTKDLRELRGAVHRLPVIGLTAAAGLATLAGVPPLSLWVTKDEVLAAALGHSPALYVAGLAGVALSAAYAAKALALLWRRDGAPQRRAPRIGPLGSGALVVLAALAVVLGVQGLPPVSDAIAEALGATGEPAPSWWELALSSAVALGAAALAAAHAARPWPAALGAWLGLERLAVAAVARPTLRLARSLAAFDDRVLDRGVTGLAGGARRLGRALGAFDDRGLDRGAVDTAVAGGVQRLARAAAAFDVHVLDRAVVGTAVGRGSQRLGRLARRPQTGQLHHYYAQATVSLLVLVLVLWLVP